MKIGRRGSQNGTLVVTGTQGHVAYPELADNPVRSIAALMVAINAEPIDSGTAHFGASNLEFTSIDVGNKTVNLIPAEARARFNIRFNDTRTREELRKLIEARAAKAAGQDPLAHRMGAVERGRVPHAAGAVRRAGQRRDQGSHRAARRSSRPPAARRTRASSRTIAR